MNSAATKWSSTCLKLRAVLLAGLFIGAVGSGAAAQDQRPDNQNSDTAPAALHDDAAHWEKIEFRVTAMKIMAGNLRALDQVAAGKRPVNPRHVNYSAIIEQIAKQIPNLFPAASDGRRARPEIWSKPADFAGAAATLARAAGAMTETLRRQDVEALRQAGKAVIVACRDCHKNFRLPKQPADSTAATENQRGEN